MTRELRAMDRAEADDSRILVEYEEYALVQSRTSGERRIEDSASRLCSVWLDGETADAIETDPSLMIDQRVDEPMDEEVL